MINSKNHLFTDRSRVQKNSNEIIQPSNLIPGRFNKENQTDTKDNLFKLFEAKISGNSNQFDSGIHRRTKDLDRYSEVRRDKKKNQYNNDLEIIQINPDSYHSSTKKMPNFKTDFEYDQQNHAFQSDLTHKITYIEQLVLKQVSFREQMQNNIGIINEKTNQNSQNIRENISQIKKIRNQYGKGFENLVKQFNEILNQYTKSLQQVKKDCEQQNSSIKEIKTTLESYMKDNDEKLQNIVIDMASMGGNRKSRNYSGYGMELRSSAQHITNEGVSNSLTMNIGAAESMNFKIYNDLNIQIDSLKKELEHNSFKIQDMENKFMTQMMRISKGSNRTNNTSDELKLTKIQIDNQINKKLKQQLNKLTKQQKTIQLNDKIEALQKVYTLQEGNILGMNEQFKRVINQKISPRIHKLQTSEICYNNHSTEINKQIKQKCEQCFTLKLNTIKLLRIRQTTKIQSEQLKLLNTDTYKHTYLLDQNNYLLDNKGYYLTEDTPHGKQRIKLEQDSIYYLQIHGMDITKVC